MNEQNTPTREQISEDTKDVAAFALSVEASVRAILVRRWYDGQNTYHSVSIHYIGKAEAVTPFRYGYGDAWKETARAMLERDLSAVKANQRTSHLYWRAFHTTVVDVVDVKRRGDLHHGGKGPDTARF